MKTCECLVLKETDNSGTHYSDEIEYCPLHANAERMREFIEKWVNAMATEQDLEREAHAILKEIGE